MVTLALYFNQTFQAGTFISATFKLFPYSFKYTLCVSASQYGTFTSLAFRYTIFHALVDSFLHTLVRETVGVRGKKGSH